MEHGEKVDINEQTMPPKRKKSKNEPTMKNAEKTRKKKENRNKPKRKRTERRKNKKNEREEE